MKSCATLVSILLLLLTASPTVAAAIDAETGMPVPAVVGDLPAALPGAEAARDDILVPLAHIADGTSKSVRALPDNVVVWQNGAWLVATDLTVPDSPVELGRYLLPAQPSDMQVIDSTVYIALRKSGGLLILDYADPAAPALVGQLADFDLLSVAVAGDRAYCGRGSSGVLIIDLSDPTAPTDINLFDTPGSANGTDIAGTTLFVAMGTSGLGIYDVSDPLAPVSLGSATTSGFCTYVQERDGIAYACDGAGLRLFDVADPTSPVLLSTYDAGDTCYEMAFTGNESVIYLVGLEGLFALMVADPSAPVVLDAAPIGNSFSCADAGSAAVMTSRYTGLHVVGAPGFDEIANVPNAGFANRVHLDGTTLYVADLSGGVRIYDLADPEAPVFLTEADTDPNTQDMVAADGVMYAVNANNSGTGLALFDVAEPASPALLATHNTNNQTFGLDLAGNLCVLANGFGGLRTVDVTDPLAPAALGDLPFGANANDVVVAGDHAFVASFGGGMLSVDIADPTSMSVLQQQFWGFLNALDVTDDLAWVADGQAGLRVVDISNPADLVSLVTFAIGGQPRDVVRSRVGSPYVYLADDFYGLRQVDVSDPTAPILLASYPSADRGMGVDAEAGVIVLAAGETGVYVYRNPAVVALEPEDDEPTVELPAAISLQAGPNPFNPRLEISYRLPEAGKVRIDVFDARGRLVRTLLQADAPAGAGSLVWDGVDRSGRPVASGVYQLRLVTDTAVRGQRVTLVR